MWRGRSLRLFEWKVVGCVVREVCYDGWMDGYVGVGGVMSNVDA